VSSGRSSLFSEVFNADSVSFLRKLWNLVSELKLLSVIFLQGTNATNTTAAFVVEASSAASYAGGVAVAVGVALALMIIAMLFFFPL